MRCHRSLSVSFSLSLFGNACQMRQESEHLRRGSHKLFAFASLIVLLLPWLLHRRRCTRVHSQHTPHSAGDGLKATVSIRGPRKESVDNLTGLSGTVDFLPHLVAPSAVLLLFAKHAIFHNSATARCTCSKYATTTITMATLINKIEIKIKTNFEKHFHN